MFSQDCPQDFVKTLPTVRILYLHMYVRMYVLTMVYVFHTKATVLVVHTPGLPLLYSVTWCVVSFAYYRRRPGHTELPR